MAEFGVQLKKTRETKGITQQSLAEKLYVTRQAVSKWELGERYPDLITAKKIANILDTNLDSLLSDDEMTIIAERNPVIEQKSPNRIVSVFLAFISFAFISKLISIIGAVIARIPVVSVADFSSPQFVISFISEIVLFFIFGYAFIMNILNKLSPKRAGAIFSIYFLLILASNICTSLNINGNVYSILYISLIILVSIVGIISSFEFYFKNRNIKIWEILIIAVSIIELVRNIVAFVFLLFHIGDFFSTIYVISFLVKMSVYGLIICETITLSRKRKLSI